MGLLPHKPKVLTITIAIFFVVSFILPTLVLAVDFSSDNFILRDPTISSGGGESSSDNFQLFSTIGQTVSSQNTSDAFTQNAGFLFFPFASAPTLSAVAGNGQVSLSWTESNATLGKITDYLVGTATSQGGSYTFESAGTDTSFTKTGLTNGTTYYFVIKAKIGFVRAATSNEASAAPTAPVQQSPGGGGGGARPQVPELEGLGSVVLQGKAYPNALVTILRNGAVNASLKANVDGTFIRTFTNVPSGISTYSIFGEDVRGRKSTTLSFTISVAANSITTISDIFLPPTIDTPATVNRNSILPINGQAFPSSTISILVTSQEITKETNSNEIGDWQQNFSTAVLEEGTHFARAKALSVDGGQSIFSEVRVFAVLPPTDVICRNGDLNSDGRVNLIDFSIMIFWWQALNSCADQNSDGVVNIIDFSILLFWWTD